MSTIRIQQDYNRRETEAVSNFLTGLKENSMKEGTFDSASAADFVSNVSNQSTGLNVPATLQAVLDEAGDNSPAIIRAVLDGVSQYEAEHGCTCPADVAEMAMHSAYSTTIEGMKKRGTLDGVADSNHSDPLSLQPNRAVVSILSVFAEAIPFAHYLPADISSNEAKLAILSHRTGSEYGAYAQGALLDGIYSGDSYLAASRVHTVKPTGAGAVTGKLTKLQADGETCKQDAAAIKLLRGRTIIYVNGRVAAREVDSTGTGPSAISGTLMIEGKSYAIGGTINTDTGDFSLTTTPALPTTVPVTVEGFIDYEREPALTPEVISAVETYSLFAKPWRALTRQTIDTRTQMVNELGLDPYSESVIAIQGQFANERHYDVLRKGLRLAALNKEIFDYSTASGHQDNSRGEVWRDLCYQLGVVSQRMAEDTMNHGVTHLYVSKRVAAQLLSMPADSFVPSGIAARPGIYRLGRLFGQYEVYYTPKVLTETATSSQILCAGRATDVGRNPVVLGDAVAPTIIPLAVNGDLRQGAGFYARNFTCVNPHDPSARGFGLIEVTNMD